MPNVTLGPYNTIAVAAASGVYHLSGASGFAAPVDVMNLGPGSVYIRSDKDPTVNDPGALALPANWALNGLTAANLGIIAGADTTISVRVRV
jgi:hypothetical protein